MQEVQRFNKVLKFIVLLGDVLLWDYPSDCVNRKLRDFSRSFFIYVLTL